MPIKPKKIFLGRKHAEEIFFNEVLPYVVMNENRENWQKIFMNDFQNT